MPSSIDYLAVLPAVIIFTILIDGIKSLTEAFLSARKILHIPREKIQGNTQLSVLIACHNGESKIAQTVKNVKASLPGSVVYVVDDCSDDRTGLEALRAGAKVLKLARNRGKVGALHRLLSHIKTDFVLIMDDDMLIDNIKIPYGLLDKFDAVAFNVLPEGNSFLSRLQRYEYRKSMEIGKTYHSSTGSVLCVSGAIGFFRTKRLIYQVDKHSGEFSGEDLERTLLIHSMDGSRGVTFVDYVVSTEVPQSIHTLFRQRCLGWNPGFMGNVVLLMRVLVSKNKPTQLRFDVFYNLVNIILDILRVLSLPILVKYPLIMITMYILYVAIDTILYIILGRKDPLWTVLIAPFYGIFCLITRFIGIFVYFYRELTELICWHMRSIPDSYKQAPLWMQFISFGGTAILLIGVLALGLWYTM
ncbi:glycosyltransferase family 2 protein [bacterium]|nr:MAG: glycosyltransferase family 2 protein [bacterium]